MTLRKKLYKICSDGKSIQTWEIHADDVSFWTISGKVDGKMVQKTPTKCPPKSNRTQEEQLDLQVNAQIKKKIDGRYVENIEKVTNAESELPAYSAMLAKDHSKHRDKVQFPAMVQRKYDGLRALSTRDGFFSRNRKQFSSCSHIWEEIKDFFDKNPNARIDGEFYTHAWKNEFEKIVSAVRKTADKATSEDIEIQKKVKYHVYDAPIIGNLNEKSPFRERYNIIKETFADYEHIIVVDTHIVHTEEEIKDWHDKWVSEGYEGAMVRNMNSPYEGKRTHNLLKVKEFMDDEFEIVSVEEGQGNMTGHAATFGCVMQDGTPFRAKLDGSHDRLKWIFHNPQEVVGKMVTVRFFGYTSGGQGVPRFPVAKAIRGLKDRSDWI